MEAAAAQVATGDVTDPDKTEELPENREVPDVEVDPPLPPKFTSTRKSREERKG